MEIRDRPPTPIDSGFDPAKLIQADASALALLLSFWQNQQIDQRAEAALGELKEHHAFALEAARCGAEWARHMESINQGELLDIPTSVTDWMKQNRVAEISQSGSLAADVQEIRDNQAQQTDVAAHLDQATSRLSDRKYLLTEQQQSLERLHLSQHGKGSERQELLDRQTNDQARLQKLQAELKANPEDSALTDQIEVLEGGLDQLDRKIAVVDREIEGLASRIQTAQASVTELTGEISALQEQMASLATRLQSLTSKIDQGFAALSSNLQKNLNGITAECDHHIKAVEEQLQHLKILKGHRDELTRIFDEQIRQHNLDTSRQKHREQNQDALRQETARKIQQQDDDLRLLDEYRKQENSV